TSRRQAGASRTRTRCNSESDVTPSPCMVAPREREIDGTSGREWPGPPGGIIIEAASDPKPPRRAGPAMPVADCLTDAELAAFAAGGVAPPTLDRWSDHLAACPACQGRLERLDPWSGPVLHAL